MICRRVSIRRSQLDLPEMSLKESLLRQPKQRISPNAVVFFAGGQLTPTLKFPRSLPQFTVKTSALLFPPLVQPKSPVFPLGVDTLTVTGPGPEITPVVSIIFSFSLLTIVAPSVLPLITTWDEDTNWLPLIVSITPLSTSEKATVLGASDAMSGAGLELVQKGFNVLPQAGRNNTASTATSNKREDIQGSFESQNPA